MGTVSASYLASYIDSCEEYGASRSDLLSLVPDHPEDCSAPMLAASTKRYPADLIFQILAKAEKATGKSELGLLCGTNLRPTSLDELGNAILCCSTLRRVILLNRKYQALTQQMGRTNLKIENGQARLLWEPHYTDPEYGRMVTDMVMAGHAVFGRWLSWVHNKKIIAVHFRHAEPAYADAYSEIFDCPVLFAQAENAMLIDADAIDAPLPQANEKTLSAICQRLDVQLAQLKPETTLHKQAANILKLEIQNGSLNLSQTARKLGMSSRGLRRSLAAEGTSFRITLEQTRRELCERYLQENIPLFNIAQRLGYSQQSAFNRAFKQWFGVTPKTYMKAQQAANTAFYQMAP